MRQRRLREKTPEGLERQANVRKEWECRGIQGRSGGAGGSREGAGVQGDPGKEWEHREIQGRSGSAGGSREGVGAQGDPGKEWKHREIQGKSGGAGRCEEELGMQRKIWRGRSQQLSICKLVAEWFKLCARHLFLTTSASSLFSLLNFWN